MIDAQAAVTLLRDVDGRVFTKTGDHILDRDEYEPADSNLAGSTTP